MLLMAFSSEASERDLKVMIAPQLGSFRVLHNGKRTTVMRNQNRRNRIVDDLALTSRDCPPHCLQPIRIKAIETVGELEVIQYLRRIEGGDRSVLVVDTRSSDQVLKGTIPGSVNVYGNHLIAEVGANPIMVEEILIGQFGVSVNNDHFDFSNAKTLVVYCFGIWCGQGPRKPSTRCSNSGIHQPSSNGTGVVFRLGKALAWSRSGTSELVRADFQGYS
jgi:rhodanese-related sulfurtransferase